MRKSKLYRRCKIIRGTRSHLNGICELDDLLFSKSQRFSITRFRYLLASPNAAFFVSMSKEGCIGYSIALKNRLRNGELKGRIYSIGVVAEWQNKGIGTELLKKSEEWLIESGSSFVTLETRVGKNGARAFFEKRGYKFSEDLPGYYGSFSGIRMKKNSASF